MDALVYAGEIDLDAEVVHDAATGVRLTNALVEDENDRIDRRYGLIPGGKSLSGDGSQSPVVRLVVSTATKEKIVRAAAAEGMSISRWLRRTVEDKLAA
jgi:hypothetical protein